MTTPADRRRTTWPTAEPLQQAADIRRAAGDPLLADWFDETANALSWLAPFRDNEPGYGMWEAALALARQVLGTTGEPADVVEAQQPTEIEQTLGHADDGQWHDVTGHPAPTLTASQFTSGLLHTLNSPPVEEEPETEAWPTSVEWIGEAEESDGLWMYFGASPDRAVIEKRIASQKKRFPTWADGTPLRHRIVRKTTTYTVEDES